jgi:hypothetical protein
MKKLVLLFSLVSVAFFAETSLYAAQSLLGNSITSPDHPRTWVVGADNVHQALRWDGEKQMLFADVKYSTVSYADDTHPTQEADYTVSFPTVKLDSSSGEFTANGVKVGMLRHGVFGTNVVLDKGVELDIHRHHGRIFAMIAPSENS